MVGVVGVVGVIGVIGVIGVVGVIWVSASWDFEGPNPFLKAFLGPFP